MTQRDQQILRDKLGDRVTFDAEIRRAYDYDLGEMPGVLLSLLKTVPDAVVVPSSDKEVAAALSAAAQINMPVTPRGQATSGYGGAITTRGGMVLDLSGMNRIISIDHDAGTVDVEPGVVWEELSRHLRKHGLDVRICPTSAPSSTVGGWFAMGGVGIGSMEYGSIADVIVEIDSAGLDGQIRTLTGDEMELEHQTCGILGVITRLRVLCKPKADLHVYAVVMPDAECAGRFVIIARKRLSPHTLVLHSPGYRRLRAEAEGHEVPYDGFLAVVAIQGGEISDADVDEAAKMCNGRVLSEDQAHAEWRARFYPMRIKKLGPSLVVSEFVLPEGNFAACWKDIETDLPNDVLGLEACVVRNGRMVMLVYLLDNAATLFYPLRMAKATRPVGIARTYGGAFYATGFWLAFAAPEVLGKEKLRAVQDMKRRVDPQNLLNPGKVLGTHRGLFPYLDLSWVLNIGARLISPLSRHLGYNRTRPGNLVSEKTRHG
jgi:FAD/FMN-containing dehydrogenase